MVTARCFSKLTGSFDDHRFETWIFWHGVADVAREDHEDVLGYVTQNGVANVQSANQRLDRLAGLSFPIVLQRFEPKSGTLQIVR